MSSTFARSGEKLKLRAAPGRRVCKVANEGIFFSGSVWEEKERKRERTIRRPRAKS
jgi:hypothetical protein